MDALGRHVALPAVVRHVICSGPGCLRYVTYLQALDKVVGVDSLDKAPSRRRSRPYVIAHPELAALPLFGELRGNDNPELIAALDPRPDLVFKTFAQMGHAPSELQEKTGIPVFVVEYGNLGHGRSAFFETLRTMGRLLDESERAEATVRYVEQTIADLDRRTRDIPVRKTAYVGGVAWRGPLGLRSTEPSYPPFVFTNTRNLAFDPNPSDIPRVDISKEQLVAWDPEVIFIDLATLGGPPEGNAWHELKTDSVYASLRAVRSREIYGVLPYNSYAQNYGSTLADAYFVGKTLYPERFTDVDPAAKADEIFRFFVGAPVFAELNESFDGLTFTRLE